MTIVIETMGQSNIARFKTSVLIELVVTTLGYLRKYQRSVLVQRVIKFEYVVVLDNTCATNMVISQRRIYSSL